MIPAAGVYRRAGRLLLSACAETEVGLRMRQEPVLELPAQAQPAQIGAAARMALDAFVQRIPHPTDWSAVRDVVTEASGAKSWKEFIRGAVSCSIEVFPNYIQITPSRNAGAKHGFVGLGTNQKVVLNPSVDAAELGEGILRALELCE